MELLLPAGNIESFFAAIEAGADAVYLGLKNFNARQRAKNFSFLEIYNIVNHAHKNKIKVYITVNTLIKNTELPELLKTLSILTQINPDAIIIQDFAIVNLVKKYFRSLKIHASTQLSAHNSLDCNFLKKQGFERVILARELTKTELISITQQTNIQTEIFVHGALCYSFSGHCLFSSYLGGNSANRGTCKQVCRRNFISNGKNFPFFSLKDLQLISQINLFEKLKISSLKVEGRMKNAEYVFNVAKAYKTTINDFSKIEKSQKMLENDFAREKTDFFYEKNIANVFTENTGTGLLLGKIFNITNDAFQINTNYYIDENSKLRVRCNKDTNSEFIKIHSIKNNNNNFIVYCNTEFLTNNMDLYLIGNKNFMIKTNFEKIINKKFNILSTGQIQKIINEYSSKNISKDANKIYLRISNLEFLNLIKIFDFEYIILKVNEIALKNILKNDIANKYKEKIVIEFPKFISENKIKFYKEIIKNFVENKFINFSISNLSQIELLPKNTKIFTNENIYILNDIAINFIKSCGISEYVYPYENDYPNLISGKNRSGIVPIYFYPELFYSRVPINSTNEISDENKNKYKRLKINGFTIIIDEKPVSLTHNFNKLQNKGFSKFLIDFSYENDIKKLEAVIKCLKKSEKITNTTDFNMKMGLK